MENKTTYAEAIRDGFDYLLGNYDEVFVIGQGVWSPWYVGNTMNNLEKKYGKERVIDTPTSESAITGLAVGASLCKKNLLSCIQELISSFMLWTQLLTKQQNGVLCLAHRIPWFYCKNDN